jgi:uncharacterized membrane protein YhaH (DUF805 family)
MAGARVGKVPRVDFWKAAVVALVSYLIMLLIAMPLLLVSWIPGLKALTALFVLGAGTAITSRMIWDIEWRTAWVIAAVVIAFSLVARLLMVPFGLS